jgi:hypothetical protein
MDSYTQGLREHGTKQAGCWLLLGLWPSAGGGQGSRKLIYIYKTSIYIYGWVLEMGEHKAGPSQIGWSGKGSEEGPEEVRHQPGEDLERKH